MRKLALAVLFVSSVGFGFVGCGGDAPRKINTGTAGNGGHGGNTTGVAGSTAGSGGGAAGDSSMAGSMAGAAGGAAGSTGGTGGGTAGATAGTGGAAGDGTAGAGGTPPPPPPPPISSSTTVLEIDNVIVGLTNAGGADAATDGGADGGVADGGDGGSDATDAGPSQSVSYKFDTTVQGWHFTSYGSTPPGPPSATNYASTSVLAWNGLDDADGVSTSGSLKGTVPFQHDGDQIDFQAFSVGAGMYNWSGGYTVTAKVKQASGGNLRQNCPITAVIYVSEANDYATTLSPPVNLVPGQWVTVTYDLSTANIHIEAVSQMGLQINTGAASACAGALIDAGTDAPADGGGTDVPVDGGTSDSSADTAGN